MSDPRVLSGLLALAALAALPHPSTAQAPGSGDSAEVVLLGGRVLTLDEAGTVASAMAVRGERIVAVGGDREALAAVGPDARRIELAGRTVVPGLGDNHFHSIGGGPGVDLSGARTLREVLDAIARRAADTPPGEIVVTNGDWHEGQLAEARLPLRDDLDRAAPDDPVVVVRGGHEYVLNSAALEKWGIGEDVGSVEGGRIGRYPDGRLNGELVDRAKELVDLPRPERGASGDLLESLVEQHRELNALGITSVRYPGTTPGMYEALRTLEEQGRLTVRANVLFRLGPSVAGDLASVLSELPGPDEGDAWVRVGGIKLGVDGGFEGGWMREPYEEPWGDGGTFHGLQTFPTRAFHQVVRGLNGAGWRVATHAVGDAAIDLVLDGYEAAHAERPITGRRWAIEHGFIARPDHFPRMRRLGLVVSLQDHLYVAAPSLVEYWGEERAALTTPVRAYLDAGVPVSSGTDSPVIPENPWATLYHFSTRGTLSAGVVGPELAVTREEALHMATTGYAWLTMEEELKGSLEPGKLADLVVLEADPLTVPADELREMEVALTMVGGRVVWER